MNRLNFYREKAHLTLRELSQWTGIGESSLSRAERGLTDLNGQTWKVVARALGCSIDELLKDKETGR